MEKKIKIILADSQKFNRDGTLALLRKSERNEVVLETQEGKKILDFLKQNHADILLLAVQLPDMSGIEVLRKIIKRYHRTQVIIFDEESPPVGKASFIIEGAKTYLTRTAEAEGLSDLIFGIHTTKEDIISPEISTAMLKILRESAKPDVEPHNLSEKEKEVALLMCDDCSNKEIAQKLSIADSTVKTHRKAIFTKTNTKGLGGLTKYGMKNKWF